MRDGTPAPGWWIASDGRWYPPELHPDVRAAAVATREAAASATAVVTPEAANDTAVVTPEAAANGTAVVTPDAAASATDVVTPEAAASGTAVVTPEAAANGTAVVTPDAAANGTAGVSPAVPDVTANGHAANGVRSAMGTIATEPRPERVAEVPEPSRLPPGRPRQNRPRGAFAAVLALVTLVVIVSVARGHDTRPSLDRAVVTTTVADHPVTTPALTAPGATSAVTTRGASAPSATAAPPVTTPSTTAGAVTPRVVSVFDLVKGNCLDGASLSDGLITTIRVVDCAEAHTHEVYYAGRYPNPDFDANKIASYANETCLAQFAVYVGIDYTRSRYQYLHIVPTQESWLRDNDRDVVCVAFEEDATITGSIANRKQ